MTDTYIATAAALARTQAFVHLSTELDRACRETGLDPWEAWRRPRALEKLERFDAMLDQTRREAARILGTRPRDRHGRFLGFVDGNLERPVSVDSDGKVRPA